MFRITFTDISKDLLKGNKALKNKKGFTLLDGDYEVEKAKLDLTNKANLTVILTDIEKGLDYVIDGIKIGSQSESIIHLIEDKLAIEDHEDAHTILMDFKNAVQMEKATYTDAKTNQKRSSTSKKSKFSFLKNKGESTGNRVKDDFMELDNIANEEIEPYYSETTEEKSNEEKKSILDDFETPTDDDIQTQTFSEEVDLCQEIGH